MILTVGGRPLGDRVGGVRAEQRELLAIFELGRKDTPAGVARWAAWFEANKSEWDYSFGDKASMLFLETRFAKYWSALLSFDLGDSFNYRRPVSGLILERLHISLTL